MPPRYAYWTIIAGGLPTAFRAAQREELLPTFQRIREKHPDAEMKWFARGKLWDSPEAARPPRNESRGRVPYGSQGRSPDSHGNRDATRDARGAPSPHRGGDRTGDKRGRDWRPGGEHRDPRQKFVDAQTLRNAAQRKERWEKKNSVGGRGLGDGGRVGSGLRDSAHRDSGHRNQAWKKPPRERPHGDPPREETRRGPGGERRGGWTDRPREERLVKADRPRPNRPHDARAPKARGAWRGMDEPPRPPLPRGPNREPRRNESTEPAPPPRPNEPVINPPDPPERGRPHARRPFQPRHGHPKGPRRR